MTGPVLSAIYLYPVKSLGGIQVRARDLDRFGLHCDRRWMVVTPEGRFMTQREFPQMAVVQSELLSGDRLKLHHPDCGEFPVPAVDFEPNRMDVAVWNDRVDAVPVGKEADQWLSEAIGVSCRLVWFPDDALRPVDSAYAGEGRYTAFSDGFPLLLIGQSSLDDLNRRLPEPLPMRRFRPNLVVTGAPPYAEDGWRQIAVGGIFMRVAKPCSRCGITTVDPATGRIAGKEPLATLATYRKRNHKVYFGQNVIPEERGTLRVGSPVNLLD
ncbi:MOSC domain-containing protein [Methylohalobius crimeensis]|uniref:MOSC domain-containing protein n=1 Tax=Methylohalobius crimeensis TaxID=244365 RepID=UPI0003B609D6|nr:MOSC N-terminal beta barrel domain-containing protein [Methylohalobius crimeensis]